jgi:hypothetical protein
MSDSNTHFDTKDGPQAPPPVQANPPAGYGRARTPPQPNARPAPGRKPLFRS